MVMSETTALDLSSRPLSLLFSSMCINYLEQRNHRIPSLKVFDKTALNRHSARLFFRDQVRT